MTDRKQKVINEITRYFAWIEYEWASRDRDEPLEDKQLNKRAEMLYRCIDRIAPLIQGGGWTTWIERFADEVAKRLPPLREFPEERFRVLFADKDLWNMAGLLKQGRSIWEGELPREGRVEKDTEGPYHVPIGGDNTYELGSQPCPECGFPVNTWDKCCPACNPEGDNILEQENIIESRKKVRRTHRSSSNLVRGDTLEQEPDTRTSGTNETDTEHMVRSKPKDVCPKCGGDKKVCLEPHVLGDHHECKWVDCPECVEKIERTCQKCKGIGEVPVPRKSLKQVNKYWKDCPDCKGTGRIPQSEESKEEGFVTASVTNAHPCQKCGGLGEYIDWDGNEAAEFTCPQCDGTGNCQHKGNQGWLDAKNKTGPPKCLDCGEEVERRNGGETFFAFPYPHTRVWHTKESCGPDERTQPDSRKAQDHPRTTPDVRR